MRFVQRYLFLSRDWGVGIRDQRLGIGRIFNNFYLGVPFGRAFRSQSFWAEKAQKGLPLQSLTQKKSRHLSYFVIKVLVCI